MPSTGSVFATDGRIIVDGGDQGPGARNTVRSQSGAWLNRIEITSDATRGIVLGSALSSFAINQTVTGAVGSTAHLSYTFGIDGTFYPGPPSHYPPVGFATPQNLTFYLLAYRGTAYGETVRTDAYGDYLYLDTSAGHTTLSRAAGPGYSSTLGVPFAAAAACFGADTRCAAGGTFADVRTISFDIATGDDYFIIGYLASQSDGQTSFFHTAKLLSLNLAPEYGLISGDGGALKRGAGGTFTLAVPEPASWTMMVVGFGFAGAALRRRRRFALE